jgi:hypothetical protein
MLRLARVSKPICRVQVLADRLFFVTPVGHLLGLSRGGNGTSAA